MLSATPCNMLATQMPVKKHSLHCPHRQGQAMAGKKGHSGRRPGTLSWYQHPTARCGHRLNVLFEVWLGHAPERRFTVPPKKGNKPKAAAQKPRDARADSAPHEHHDRHGDRGDDADADGSESDGAPYRLRGR